MRRFGRTLGGPTRAAVDHRHGVHWCSFNASVAAPRRVPAAISRVAGAAQSAFAAAVRVRITLEAAERVHPATRHRPAGDFCRLVVIVSRFHSWKPSLESASTTSPGAAAHPCRASIQVIRPCASSSSRPRMSARHSLSGLRRLNRRWLREPPRATHHLPAPIETGKLTVSSR